MIKGKKIQDVIAIISWIIAGLTIVFGFLFGFTPYIIGIVIFGVSRIIVGILRYKEAQNQNQGKEILKSIRNKEIETLVMIIMFIIIVILEIK